MRSRARNSDIEERGHMSPSGLAADREITVANLVAKQHYLIYPHSWLPSLNPYAGLACTAAARWFRSAGIVGDRRSKQILDDERPDLYGGYPYPTANLEHLTVVTKFLALWMLFDDL